MFLRYVLFFYGQLAKWPLVFGLNRVLLSYVHIVMAEARAKQFRESKRRRRDETRGLTLPCDICSSTEGPELHCVASLSQKSFDLLCQVSGCQLSKSACVCCKHFTIHSKRPSSSNPLIVETEFATSFLMTPSTRKKPTVREIPKQNVFEIGEEEKHISIPQLSQIEELEREVVMLQKQNLYLRMKVEELEDENKDLRRERDAEHEMRVESEKKEKKRKEKNCLDIFGINQKEISERKLKYWFGVETFQILFHEWEPFIITTWNTLFLVRIFLVWLKHGFAMTFLSHILQKDKTTVRRNFFKLIDDLQAWAKAQISWPSIDEWENASSHKLRFAYPSTLFFWVDGTVVKVWSPKDMKSARTLYNAKHGYHAYSFFVVVRPDGHICYISKCLGGSEHDATHWNHSDVFDHLQMLYSHEIQGKQYSIGGDKAYKGIRRPENWQNHVTLTALTEEEESDDEDNEDMNVSWWKGNFIADPRIAPFRAVVERTIGAMKRWQILTNEPLLSLG